MLRLIWAEEEMKNHIINYVWEKDTPTNLSRMQIKKLKKAKIIEAKKPEHIPEVEILNCRHNR